MLYFSCGKSVDSTCACQSLSLTVNEFSCKLGLVSFPDPLTTFRRVSVRGSGNKTRLGSIVFCIDYLLQCFNFVMVTVSSHQLVRQTDHRVTGIYICG